MLDKPIISIVTPSFNQEQFLHSAINSVLGQKDNPLEYVIIDGGSEDNSVPIIETFAGDPRLIYWVSEQDSGQYDALNKGFSHTSGEIMAWLNSDDMYLPHTLNIVANIFEQYPQIEWLTTTQHVHLNKNDEMVLCRYVGGYNRQAFWRGNNLVGRNWFARAIIQQESTFWRRSLWDRAGGFIDTTFELAGDFELWTRFYQHAELYAVDVPLAGFRKHDQQKTAKAMEQYGIEAEKAFKKAGGKPYGRIHSSLRKAIWYAAGYRSYQHIPRSLGRLLENLGIFFPVHVFVWQNGQWEIVNDYTI